VTVQGDAAQIERARALIASGKAEASEVIGRAATAA
jgi:hypothetical protein